MLNQRPWLRLHRSLKWISIHRRRGLGLLDAVLASAVLAVLVLWGGQVLGHWAEGRVVSVEARTVAELARAGRLLVEGNVTHAARTHGVNAAPLSVAFSELTNANLRPTTLGTLTPGRRTLSLWMFRPSNGTVLVIARARGSTPLARVPAAVDGVSGVGVLLTGETRLRGPGIDYDMAAINGVSSGFATANDIFAFDSVAFDIACRSYLYRVALDCDGDGTPDAIANTMTVDLDMGDNNITNVANLTTTTATVGTLTGETDVTGDVTITGAFSVQGDSTVQALDVTGAITAESVDINGELTVEELTATAEVTGADLTFDGVITVSGDARLGDADVNTLNVNTLNVRQLSSDNATIRTNLLVTDATVTTCTGCNPLP
ncbi:MAG: hypothetical protein OXC62_06355 [Aestuariivita sp.]|nr:hypothetical protein [Aestuariivita sp.]